VTLTPHELNTDFEWQDRTGPFRVLSEAQAEQYNRCGFVVLQDVFDPQTIRELIAEIDPIEAKMEQLVRDHFDGKMFIVRADEITFTTHLVKQSPRAKSFTELPFFRDLAFDLLGDDVRLYWDQAVYKKPGTTDPFPWHQDNGYTYVEPQVYLTCWIALTDADEDNGCPLVMSGKHRAGTYAHQMTDLGWDCSIGGDASDQASGGAAVDAEEDIVVAPVRAGGMVVFSSLTPHKTGPNLTADDVRKTYIVQFAPDGAHVLTRENDELKSTPCDNPELQYPILIKGHAPEAKPS
jgi:ectoine hydroxylase-related dioxygenase (phytanoyl-CoA dioxygenase family)